MNIQQLRKRVLEAGVAVPVVAFLSVGFAAPAYAQDAARQSGAETTQEDLAPTTQENVGDQEIVVTGTLFRRTNTETVSPVTVLSAETLQERGINSVDEAILRISSNNAGSMPNAWNAQGNFAQGASGVSLRGLTTNSTLVLFDGLRNAYYPLADDGTRNFVDLNTIPDALIDRIEILRDGASSLYGADAIAGVVNVIIKKQVTGVHLNASSGISQRGDGAEKRIDLTAGIGDLDDQGFNFYVSGEYQRNDPVYNRGRGYPFNTADFSQICGESIGDPEHGIEAGSETCMINGIRNGIQANGDYYGFGTTTVPFARPGTVNPGADPNDFTQGTTFVPGSRFQMLNPALGCQGLTGITLTPEQLNTSLGATAPANGQVCQQDLVAQYGVLQPLTERAGIASRMTARVTDDLEAYAMFNYYQARVAYENAPNAYRVNIPAGFLNPSANTASLYLPVYVCAAGEDCATAADRQLNPNNPFAAQGQVARIYGMFGDIENSTETLSRSYRAAAGLQGTINDVWQVSFDITGSRVDLKREERGNIYAARLFEAIGRGTYNFMDPSQNTQADRDFIAPPSIHNSTSEMFMAQASVGRDLFELPGGPLQLGVGASIRYEAIDNPSGNPEVEGQPFERYFVLNGTGFTGSRWVRAGYGEIVAPILDQVEVNLSGRYDNYSSGQDNFSPRAAVKITPIPEIALRGSWSKGFRIPSFAEANGLPTTGYITVAAPPESFQALHPGTNYDVSYSLGLTSVGTPDLEPEKSRNITIGAIVQPVSWFSATVDYFNIKKTGVIAGADYSPAIGAYYANNGDCSSVGLTCVAGTPDVNNPDAMPILGRVEYPFQNLNAQKVSGIDFGADARIPLGGGVRLISSVEASYLIKLETEFPDGTTQRYDGTLGPYNITSASGSPKWRGSWQNTLDFGSARLTATAYYTSGYGAEAEDVEGVRGECPSGGSVAFYEDGVTPVECDVDATFNLDLTGSVDVTDRATFYVNVLNVLDEKPAFDPNTYGGVNYNPAWGQSNIMGRYVRVGVRTSF
jgi:iron complex outermembrane receptor protein